MKPIFTAKHPAEAHLIRGVLESAGIPAEVRGDQLYGAFGELPVLPTVWIATADAGAEARRLIADFLNGTPAHRHQHERWVCAGCGTSRLPRSPGSWPGRGKTWRTSCSWA
jgi:hypothetical protein